MTMIYEDFSKEEIFAKHKEIEQFVNKKPIRELNNNERNIGILSGDFKNHACEHFISTLISNHKNITLFNSHLSSGYPNEVMLHNDKNLAVKQIQDKNISILIDLSVHTNHNRFDVLMEKPADIIVNYLGYPETSGSSIYDYRIVDEITDPKGQSLMTEQPYYFNSSFLCYDYKNIEDANVKIQKDTEKLTFGSFNRFSKLNEKTLFLFKKLLDKYTESTIIFKNRTFVNKYSRDYVLKYINESSRVKFLFHDDSFADHLNQFNKINIMLDPLHYNGTCSTAESLCMGVPVLTLTGDRHSCRVSSSMLINSDLQEWCATDEEDFINKAGQSFYPQEISRKFKEGKVCDKELHMKNWDNFIHSL